MKIKLYVDNVLKEECNDDGFVILVKRKNTRFLNLFSDEKAIVSPYYEKEYLLPNGNLYIIGISTSSVFQEVANIVKQFKGLKYVELCDGNAKLQIEC